MPTQPPRICVVGSANMDLTIRAARLPEPGETLAAHSLLTGFGGKGANQAVMAARLDAQVSFIGKVGDDTFAVQTLDNFRRLGINVTHVGVTRECATGTAAIIVNESGENRIFLIAGANRLLSVADVEAAAPVICSADAVLAQLEVPLDATLAAFRIARAAGARTILNPAPAQPLSSEVLALTEVLIPNAIELQALAQRELSSHVQIIDACRRLLECGPRRIVVTLGEQGALLVDHAGAAVIPGFRVSPCDTTGAGDAFIGSLAVSWAEGLDPSHAVRRAHAAAALSVTRPGTQASYPNRQEVLDFLERASPRQGDV